MMFAFKSNVERTRTEENLLMAVYDNMTTCKPCVKLAEKIQSSRGFEKYFVQIREFGKNNNNKNP